jgi:hypothetical protein
METTRHTIGPWVPAMWSTLRRCFLLILGGQGQKTSRTAAVCSVGRKLSSITFWFR